MNPKYETREQEGVIGPPCDSFGGDKAFPVSLCWEDDARQNEASLILIFSWQMRHVLLVHKGIESRRMWN